MSGMFQRIARRHADRSDEPVATQDADTQASATAPADGQDAAAATPDGHATEPAPDAPTERIELVAPAPAVDQPTVFQPPVAAAEQPTTIQPPVSVAPPQADAPASAPAAPAAAAAPAASAPAPVAAEQAPAAAEPAPRRPGFRARGRMRRRLRYLRKLRELQVRDLGGLAFDLRRFERKRDDLVAQKVDQIRACDDELRALEHALDERRDVRDVREPGIGGTCPRCFAVFGSADRFCSNCGAALGGAVQGPAQVPLAHAPVAPPQPAPAAPPAQPAPASPSPAPPSPASPPEADASGSRP